MKVNKATLSLELVNEETGELTTTDYDVTELVASKVGTVKKTSTRKKKVEDNDPDPKLTLEDNKYVLNEAAVTALGVEAGDRIDIKYEIKNKQENPIIGSSENLGTPAAGNKLTKSNTVSFRGKNHDKLAQYGTVFTFKPSPKGKGTFYIIGDAPQAVPVNEEPVDNSNDVDIQAEIDNLSNADSEVLPDDLNFTL